MWNNKHITLSFQFHNHRFQTCDKILVALTSRIPIRKFVHISCCKIVRKTLLDLLVSQLLTDALKHRKCTLSRIIPRLFHHVQHLFRSEPSTFPAAPSDRPLSVWSSSAKTSISSGLRCSALGCTWRAPVHTDVLLGSSSSRLQSCPRGSVHFHRAENDVNLVYPKDGN